MKFVFIILIFVGLTVRAATPELLTVEQMSQKIVANNKDIVAAKLKLEAATRRSGHFLRSFLPKFKVYGGHESFETGVYSKREQLYWGGEASINVFRGGKDSLESSILNQQKIIAEVESKGTSRDVSAIAENLYWTHVALLELVGAYEEIRQLNEKNYSAAKVRISRGVSTDTDRIEFEIFRGQLDEELESFKHEALLVRTELAPLIGLDNSFTTVAAIPHSHDETLLNLKKEDLKSSRSALLEAKEKESSLRASLSNSWWLPSAEIYGGQYQHTLRERDSLNERDRMDTVFGIRLTFNLDPFGEGYLSSARSIDERAVTFNTRQEIMNFNASLEVAQEHMKHEHELIHLSEERIKLGQTYFNKTLDEYRRGVKNSVDVLNATQKVLGFKKEYIERRKNYYEARTDLLRLMNN